MTHPLSTYRVQLTADFGFADAQSLIPYLSDLGISHLYLSPVLAARPGSRHFYDVADHGRVDPALGGEDGLRSLAAAVHEVGMGLIGDLVPHHMGIGQWSPPWEQLLEGGRSSEAAKFFDVDWETPLPGATDKVILPVLDRSYGDVLAAGELRLRADGGHVRVAYGELSFPINAAAARAVERSGLEGVEGVPGEPRTWQRMHSLLEQQHYRLVSMSAGVRLVNYRRYQNVDSLAAVRVEDPSVFDVTHAKLVQLVTDGVLDGLRIDHIDGLADPTRYLQRLREQVGEDVWLVVESLTTPELGLPESWPVEGTTGYEALRTNLGLHVDPAGLAQLQALAARHDGLPSPRDQWRMKADALDSELGPDLRRCARVFWSACQDEPTVRDVDYRTLLEAVSRLATAYQVYRTYVDPQTGDADEVDEQLIADAVDMARHDGGRGNVPDALWEHLLKLLGGNVRWTAAAGEAVTRFQQLTGPVLALGMEWRLFSRHQALAAACELGCHPDDVPRTLARAHAEIVAAPARGMRTTATHDTKHAEDVRLRIAALTGMAEEWVETAERLVAQTAPPDVGLALRLLQVAVGAWPQTDTGSGDLDPLLSEELRQRLVAYAVQTARSQAAATSHREPDEAVEQVITRWTRLVLQADGPIAPALRPFAVRAAEIGMAASLSQSLVRLTIPGVADTYQGTERWDDSLSDPDNRRPVDFAALAATTGDLRPEQAASLWAARRDGRVKQHVVRSALRLRRERPEVLGPGGGYQPLTASGRWAEHLLVFGRGRADGDPEVVVLAPRILGRVTDGGRFEPRGRIWADTDLVLPGQTPWRDVLSGHTVSSGPVAVADLLLTLPVAMLVPAEQA